MKLIFPIYPPPDSSKSPLYIKMALYFQKKYNFNLVAITYGESSRRFLKKYKEIHWQAIYDFQNFLLDILNQDLNIEKAIKLEAKYGIPNFGLYTTANQSLFYDYKRKYRCEDVAKIIIAYLYFWEELFKKENPSIFIDEGIAGLNSTIWKVAKEHNTSIFNLISARIPNRFVITHHSYDSWGKTNQIFSELKKRKLTREEKKEAEDFLKKFMTSKLENPYMKVYKRPPSISLKAPLHFLQYLYRYYFLGEKKNLEFQFPYDRVKKQIGKIWRYNLLKLVKKWESPVKDEKFILYPLQLQPEASTLVLAPFYLDQLALIENIAQSLPVNYRLYVKEHPSCAAWQSFSYYKRILRIPNVRLISPWADTYQLIQKSGGIATITSTVGWEAILYEKPVILFGNVFYDIFDLIYRVKDITELPIIIKKALTNFKPNKELLLKFILSILKGTYKGEIAIVLPYACSDQNVKNLCEVIIEEINKTCNYNSLKTSTT